MNLKFFGMWQTLMDMDLCRCIIDVKVENNM